MENKKQSEEIQSRRDFFKKAAKSALPILGAVLLANAPAIVKAAEPEPMGCSYSCTGMCKDNCSGGCKETCTTVCARTCSGYCNSSCSTTCRGVSY